MDRVVAGLKAGVVGGAALLDLADQRAGVGVDVELVGELRIERLRGDADVGVLDLAAIAQLVDRALGEVDRHREADALVTARGGVDLLVDPDHVAVGVEQRAARVAGVDRGVGLDRAVDLELAQRVDRAVGGRDDADRQRLLLAERAADRRHRLADRHVALGAERQRLEVEALGVDLEQRDVRVAVEADDLGLDLVVVGKLDVDLLGLVERPGRRAGGLGVGDDVGVGDDLAVVGDHEARALSLAATAAEDRRPGVAEDRDDRDHAGRRFLVDAAGVEGAVGRLDDDPPGIAVIAGRGRLGLRRGGGRAEPSSSPQATSPSASTSARTRAASAAMIGRRLITR